MTRLGIDCTGGNAGFVRASMPLPDVMFWYGTGTTAVQWTESEKTLFPASIMVEIDQGAKGSPVMTATVRDVESGAWAPGQAVDRTGWNVPRPTIYCDRDTLPSVIADGWEGDVWLAWPGWNGIDSVPHGKCTIVAVQRAFYTQYDASTILDPTWPDVAAVAPVAMSLSVSVVDRTADMAFAEVEGADHYVIQCTPPGSAKASVILRAVPFAYPGVRHLSDVAIPGSHGGIVTVSAIVNGKSVLVGTRTLP